VRFLRLDIILPQPLATAVPGTFLPLNLRLELVSTAPPFSMLRTFAFLVFETTVFPFAPARFFFAAVARRSSLERDIALLLGKHRSGFFLSLEVPQGPLIDPSEPIRTQFCSRHFFSSPI